MMSTEMDNTFYLQNHSGRTYVNSSINHIMDLTVSCLKQQASVLKRLLTLATYEDTTILLHRRLRGF